MKWPGMKRLLLRLAVLTVSAVVSLLICEAALRILDIPPPPPGAPRYLDQNMQPIQPGRDEALFSTKNENYFIKYNLRPHTTAFICYDRPWMDYFDAQGRIPIQINSHGLRDVEFSKEPAPSVHRILCLGDSFTFGHGVPLRDSYPKQMEKMLGEKYVGTPFEVVNAGFGAGPDLANHVAFLMVQGTAMKPRTVILTVCLNDVGDVPMDLRQDARIAWPGRSRFRILQLLASGVESLKMGSISDPDDCFRRHYPDPEENYWQESLIIAQTWCTEHDLNLLVVIYPMLVSLDDRYPWIRFHERITDHCRKNKIEVVDLLEAFKGKDARSLWAHVSDQHPNPEGHAIAARAIIQALEKRRWIP